VGGKVDQQNPAGERDAYCQEAYQRANRAAHVLVTVEVIARAESGTLECS
jgi:hypothetical protein